MTRTWSVKLTTCTECPETIEWTTRKPKWCKECYRKRKTEQQAGYNGKRPKVGRIVDEPDPLPEVDWLMEQQFKNFFSLVKRDYRYKKPRIHRGESA